MYTNKPYFSEGEGDGGGVAAAETTETKTEATVSETTGETKSEETESTDPPEIEEDDFSFADEGSSEPKGAASAGTTAATTGTEPEKVSKLEYDKVVEQFNNLKVEFERYKALFEQPIVKSAAEFVAAKGAGAELDPAEFFETTFGVDAQKMSAEDLIRLEIKNEAATIGVNLSDEDIEDEFHSRFANYESLTNLQKAAKIKQLREAHTRARSEKMKALVDEKAKAAKEANDYWSNQDNLIATEIENLLKAGVKDFGLKGQFTQKEKDSVLSMIANGFLKFDSNKNVNAKHVIEVAAFASNPQEYIKKVSERAVERYKAEELKKRATGTSLNPSATTLPSGKEAPKQPTAGGLKLKAVPISQIK